jgi:hypothetical protein
MYTNGLPLGGHHDVRWFNQSDFNREISVRQPREHLTLEWLYIML